MRSTSLLLAATTVALATARNQLTFNNVPSASGWTDRAVDASSSALLGAERWAAEGVRKFKDEFHLDGGMHCQSAFHACLCRRWALEWPASAPGGAHPRTPSSARVRQ